MKTIVFFIVLTAPMTNVHHSYANNPLPEQQMSEKQIQMICAQCLTFGFVASGFILPHAPRYPKSFSSRALAHTFGTLCFAYLMLMMH